MSSPVLATGLDPTLDAAAVDAEPAPQPPETPCQRLRRDFMASRLAVAGLVLLALVMAVAVFAPWISPQNPYDIGTLDIFDTKLPPGSTSSDGRLTYWPSVPSQ